MKGTPSETQALIDLALREDIGAGDWTTLWTVPPERLAEASVVAKQPCVIAGTEVAGEVFHAVEPQLEVQVVAPDGTAVEAGTAIVKVSGPARGVLTAERTALNFLQRLSGIATLTRTYVEAVAGTGARIVDTRKTSPGMRRLEKAAVVAGGGTNHRFGLHDMILIKDNHIAAAGGIAGAVEAVKEQDGKGLAIEVEATNLKEVDAALDAGVDRVLLDNMPLALLRSAVERVHAHGEGAPRTEASGGISLESVRQVAETGVDYVSVGALTHSAPAADLSLRLRPA
ncbi:carboxylating nicotinate-nucleotide diphosphorylase [soil metagenome]